MIDTLKRFFRRLGDANERALDLFQEWVRNFMNGQG